VILRRVAHQLSGTLLDLLTRNRERIAFDLRLFFPSFGYIYIRFTYAVPKLREGYVVPEIFSELR
jgi:hypothetical protein